MTVNPSIAAEAAREYREERYERSRIIVGPPAAPIVDLVRADGIEPEPFRWLWKDWLARGKLHILGGAPGAGKTTICLRVAAAVSNGGVWPDGTLAPTGNVIIWSGEDDPADTLVPRLIAAGAETRRIFFVGGVREGGKERAFDPSKDIGPLSEAIELAGGAALIVVDPVVNAVAGDSHKNSETRRGLQPLVDLAAGFDAALVGITHLTKGTSGKEPVERITGSLAFGALARIVLIAAKRQDEGEDSRILCRAKSNIGPDDGGFAYRLRQIELATLPGFDASVVEWLEPVEGSARELLGDGDEAEGGASRDAETFLKALLADGPMSAQDVIEAAEANGISERTLKRAKKALGVKSTKARATSAGGWQWSLDPSSG